MNRFLVLGFEYKHSIEYCLIRYSVKADCHQYAITVMNGTLEKLLFGNHFINEKDGFLQLEMTDNEEQFRLKEQIAKALGELLDLSVQKIAAVK